jgi:hypothetical protein
MRLSLFILGVFSALICIEKPAEAQNQPWWDEADAVGCHAGIFR